MCGSWNSNLALLNFVAVLLPGIALPNRHLHLLQIEFYCCPVVMEVLFEYRGSRRQLSVSDKSSITRVVSSELQRVGKPRAQVFTANDSLPTGRSERARPDIYLLQKWSTQWDCYVDVAHYNEVSDGDKLAVIAKPKPPSKVSSLLSNNHIATPTYELLNGGEA